MEEQTEETVANETPEEDQPVDVEASETVPDGTPEEESFPRDYVEKLRQENGKYRQRAQQADDLAHRLHVELVRATGKLADPTDLPFQPEYLEDPEALALAVEELLATKPHLASRKPVGEIGQGPAKASGTVDLASLLRQRAV